MVGYEYCDVCQRSLVSEEWKKHNYTNNHKYKLKKFLKYQYDAIKHCIISDLKLTSRKRKKESLSNNDIESIYKNSLKFECRFCKFKISNTTNINDTHGSEKLKVLNECWKHLSSFEHKQSLNEFWFRYGVNIVINDIKSKSEKIPLEFMKSSHKLFTDEYEKLLSTYDYLIGIKKSKSDNSHVISDKNQDIILPLSINQDYTSDLKRNETIIDSPQEIYNAICSIMLPPNFKFITNTKLNHKRVGAEWSNRVILFLNSNPHMKENIEKLAKYGTLDGKNESISEFWFPKFGGAWSTSRSNHMTQFKK